MSLHLFVSPLRLAKSFVGSGAYYWERCSSESTFVYSYLLKVY
ncbi:hypothetical protein BFJ66_g17816 [Fusarium oxysporum f. sp. cepae]|nr:hypothetical protein BFJ66_g17816 [Fusarium oxysporum f. sp. cepae]